jgi:hypothetical protein
MLIQQVLNNESINKHDSREWIFNIYQYLPAKNFAGIGEWMTAFDYPYIYNTSTLLATYLL